MKVKEIMTKSPAYCTPATDLCAAAKMLCDTDCGELPVVDDEKTMKPVGVITDRDIACRAVAQGRNPLELSVSNCMSSPAVTVQSEADVNDCCALLEEHQIRRLPVIEKNGRLCGIVAQADIALKLNPQKTAEVVRQVSQATA